MKSFLAVSLVILAIVANSAYSSDESPPIKTDNQSEQIKLLLAKIEKLEKRMAVLEKENQEIRHEFHLLTSYTEIGVPLDVERAMLGDKVRLRAYEPHVTPNR